MKYALCWAGLAVGAMAAPVGPERFAQLLANNPFGAESPVMTEKAESGSNWELRGAIREDIDAT